MKTGWTGFFFDAMFRDPEPFGWQIDCLASFWERRWLVAEISLAMLTTGNRMKLYLVGHLHLSEVMSSMAFLPTRLLPTLLFQAFRHTHKAIRGRRQTAIMAILRLLPLQHFYASLQPFEALGVFLQPFDGLNGFFQTLAQCLLFLLELLHFLVFFIRDVALGCLLRSQLLQFFLCCHILTVANVLLILQLHSPSE